MLSWLRSPHSLVLYFDCLNPLDADEMENQLVEVGRYWKFVPLSELLQLRKKKRKLGVASVVIGNARKSFQLYCKNRFIDREIPFTLMIRTDCVGVNRLPIEEELSLLNRTPDSNWREMVFKDPKKAQECLDQLKLGKSILPLNELDPAQFFMTWGEILELPMKYFEPGLTFSFAPTTELLRTEVRFLNQQIHYTPKVLYLPSRSGVDTLALAQCGMEALITPRSGLVDKSTDLWDIPIFTPERKLA